MNKIYIPPKIKINNYGNTIRISKTPIDFIYLLGLNINDIILFDNGTQELIEQGVVILPRNYFIFVGIKDNEIQFKPYEFNQYRIVVSTINNIIISIDSIG